MKKPDFIVIGASRCGTTWLHDNLQVHPSVFIPDEPGEMHFFSKNYEKGMDFYLSHFKNAKENQVVGEVTPDYLYRPEVAQRIKNHLPQVKLIVALRHPVDRLHSMYRILKDKYVDKASLSFKEMLEDEPRIIEEGFYAKHLHVYLDIFGRDQIKIQFFDKMVGDPGEYLRETLEFIGVNGSFQSPFLEERINRSGFLKHSSRFKFLFPYWRLAKKMKLNKLAYRIEALNSNDSPEFDATLRKELIELYRPKNAALSELLGTNLDHWNS